MYCTVPQKITYVLDIDCRYGAGEGDESVGGGGEMKQAEKRSIVEDTLQAVSRYLLKTLSSQHSIQALETMAQSIR